MVNKVDKDREAVVEKHGVSNIFEQNRCRDALASLDRAAGKAAYLPADRASCRLVTAVAGAGTADSIFRASSR